MMLVFVLYVYICMLLMLIVYREIVSLLLLLGRGARRSAALKGPQSDPDEECCDMDTNEDGDEEVELGRDGRVARDSASLAKGRGHRSAE